MPAAAVIPAPIAYINVVAVKKLVVGFLFGFGCETYVKRSDQAFFYSQWQHWCGRAFTLRKLECFKQAFALNTTAWNNTIGLRAYLLVSGLK